MIHANTPDTYYFCYDPEYARTLVESDAGWRYVDDLNVLPPTGRGEDTPYHREAGKPRVDLLQFGALLEVAKVAAFGAKKYGERNWEKHANEWSWGALAASALRHLFAWLLHENNDQESGLSHLAHAAWNVLTLLELVIRKFGKDDRTTVMTKESIHVQLLEAAGKQDAP